MESVEKRTFSCTRWDCKSISGGQFENTHEIFKMDIFFFAPAFALLEVYFKEKTQKGPKIIYKDILYNVICYKKLKAI